MADPPGKPNHPEPTTLGVRPPESGAGTDAGTGTGTGTGTGAGTGAGTGTGTGADAGASAVAARVAAAAPTSRRRLWIGLAATVLLVGAAVAVVAYRRSHGSAGPCGDQSHRLAGVWDDRLRMTVRDRLHSLGRPYLEATATLVEQRLDRFAESWRAMHREVCQAHAVEGTQSQAVRDLRLACLDRRLARVHAVTRLLQAADLAVARRAAELVLEVDGVGQCGGVSARARAVPLPEDPLVRRRIAAVRADLEDAEVQLHAGRYPAGVVLARDAAARAGRLSAPPLVAEADLVLGELESASGDPARAEAAARAALGAAGADPALRARSLALLSYVVGAGQHRFDQADELARQAGQALDQAGQAADDQFSRPPALVATVERWLGQLDRARGELRRAADHLEKVVVARRAALGERHLGVARAEYELAAVFRDSRELGRAEEHYRSALSIREAILGGDHPDVADVLTELGDLAQLSADFESARADHQRALTIREQALPPGDPELARSLDGLGMALFRLNQIDPAIDDLRRALTLREAALGLDQVEVGTSHLHLADALRQAGQLDRARDQYQKAVDIYRQRLGPEDPRLALVLTNLAAVCSIQGDFDRALAALEEALPIQDKKLPPGHPQLAAIHDQLAGVLARLGRPEEAIEQLQRALDLYRQSLAPDHPRVALAYRDLSRAYNQAEQPKQALEAARKGLEIWRALAPDDAAVAELLDQVALAQLGLGRYRAARASLERGLAIRRAKYPDTDFRTALSHYYLARVWLAEHRFREAAREAEQAVAGLTGPEQVERHAAALSCLGEAKLALGEDEAARGALQAAVERFDQDPPPGEARSRAEAGRARFALARALRAGGGAPERIEALVAAARADLQAAIDSGDQVSRSRQELAALARWHGE